MGRTKKQTEDDEMPGAPEWMVTFSDCMTLLLTFFVLLLSFSSFDNKIFRRLKVIYSTGLTTITPTRRSDRDALIYIPPVRHVSDLDKGSERPTLETENVDGLLKAKNPFNFTRGIVFMLPSSKIFWGNGVAISTEGRQIIDKMALFLLEVPHRIVISEYGVSNNQAGESLGLHRAWTVMDYFTAIENLDKKRFCISSISTHFRDSNESSGLNSNREETGRIVEIALLARNIYN